MGKIFDTIIVGGGAAGLTAAVYAQRAGLDFVMLDVASSMGSQLTQTDEVENYTGMGKISGMELVMKFREHAQSMGANMVDEGVQEIKKDGAILDNYKLINYTVETDSDGNPALSFEQVEKYYNQIAGAVPEGIGIAVNPFKAEGITLKDTQNSTNDYTEDATRTLFDNMGSSPLLFGVGANPTYKVIELSLIVDATMMMKLLRQIERVFNVKYQREMSLHGDYLFEIYFLDQYSFNKDEVANRMQKAAM